MRFGGRVQPRLLPLAAYCGTAEIIANGAISMKHEQLKFTKGFRVAIGNAKSQSAVMVLGAGGCEGGPDNRHLGADQWLIVTEGNGTAIVNGRNVALKAGTIVLIEAGDTHEIRNTGRSLLKTVSVYLPPAYDADGEELKAGKP
jgi:mannose-6-phosphate isomerase-like protein (cupin superfamily)